VLTIFGPDGKQVQVENNRVEIRLHATADAGYYASLWWTRVTGFIVSLQGLVVAIAAIVAVMGGAAMRKRRNEPSQRQAPE
jgi:membrane protein implicated in regulation of membrane protease activity